MRKIKNFFIYIGIFTLLFIFINIIAGYYVIHFPKGLWSSQDDLHVSVVSPTSQKGKKLMLQLFGREGETFIKAIQNCPPFKQHPILHYIVAPTKNNYYTIGLEGARYFEENKDTDITKILESDKAIYVLGGSTTFGYGVRNNQTIPFYLQDLINQHSNDFILNFGTPAYDQLREIDKLVYLLRSGYRPKLVIFIDGLNDIIGIARSNYRIQDKIVYHGFSAGKGDRILSESSFRLGTALTAEDFKFMIINALPFVRAYKNWKTKPTTLAQFTSEKNSFVESFDWNEAEFFFFNWPNFGVTNQEKLNHQIIKSYSKNIEFLEGLSKSFGFKYVIFFQPMGYMNKDNPFVKPEALSTKGYKYYQAMINTIKQEISNGTLKNMVDISDSLNDGKETNYIDSSHYSPEANKKIATAIYEVLLKKNLL